MKPMAIFYLLVIYVLLQFSWWSYLLIELNKEVFVQKSELISLKEGIGEVSKIEDRLYNELKERWVMVAGEGAVFLGILLFGIYKTRSSFRKEFELAKQQKNFLLSITHEFKSPLAAVKLNLQTLQKRNLSNEQQQAIIGKAVNEADRIDNLIENALLATRLEGQSFSLNKEEFNLSDCVSSTIHNRIIPGENNHRFEMDVEPGLYMIGDSLAVASILLNLAENAEKYSPENTVINVRLNKNKSGDHAILTVADTGAGIPEQEKKKVFEKF